MLPDISNLSEEEKMELVLQADREYRERKRKYFEENPDKDIPEEVAPLTAGGLFGYHKA